ncbi:hypothetical protein MA16_Dca029233 [Dendrobium catenatum]|uniref:Uncharacterized protein n=1 Tax=Dendrobium catenatum TaxID=906689 RepID=A0A2I0VB41_9ASPA|nr:hypothetical protein MA16_Dca029233 [Dendrobium catenatum]
MVSRELSLVNSNISVLISFELIVEIGKVIQVISSPLFGSPVRRATSSAVKGTTWPSIMKLCFSMFHIVSSS